MYELFIKHRIAYYYNVMVLTTLQEKLCLRFMRQYKLKKNMKIASFQIIQTE